MTGKQQLLYNLHSAETSILKKEKDFDIRTHLIEIFKILSRLFEDKESVSKEDVVDVAKRESRKRGIEDRYNNWNEVFGLEKRVAQNVEKQSNTGQKLNVNLYPDNFYVGQV